MSSCQQPVTPSMVKEYYYCPYALYLRYALGLAEPPTASIEEGAENYARLRRREEKALTFLRRKLPVREKHLALHLYSQRHCLEGVLDALLVLEDGSHIPVEIKASRATRIPLRHYYQLAAYAVLVEENYRATVTRALAYYTLTGTLLEARITTAAKRHITRHTLPAIRRILDGEPPSPRPTPRCKSCGYHRHCRTV